MKLLYESHSWLQIDIPHAANWIISTLSANGYEAFVVGGCVRDSFIGKKPKDWDICTNAKPDQVKSCFDGCRIIDTGIKHGTVTILVEDEAYEVTTYRIDGEYTDHRRPDEVRFTGNLTEDLSRRDFTMNAMAYNDEVGLYDPFGGRKDLLNKTIKCVGDPDTRFQEDALRILRAMRFASVYGFRIGIGTELGIMRTRNRLEFVSKERIREELCKMLLGDHFLEIMENYSYIIIQIIPELSACYGFAQNNPYHTYTVYGHIAHAVDAYKGKDLKVKLALLLHDVGKPLCYSEDEKGGHFYGHAALSSDLARQIMDKLKFDSKTKNDVVELVHFHDAEVKPTPRAVRKWLNKIGEEQFRRLLEVKLADIKAHSPANRESMIERIAGVKEVLEEVIAKEQCFTLKDLHINGNDIINLGVLEGRAVGEILNYLLNEVIEGRLENKHHDLTMAADLEIYRRSDEMNGGKDDRE